MNSGALTLVVPPGRLVIPDEPAGTVVTVPRFVGAPSVPLVSADRHTVYEALSAVVVVPPGVACAAVPDTSGFAGGVHVTVVAGVLLGPPVVLKLADTALGAAGTSPFGVTKVKLDAVVALYPVVVPMVSSSPSTAAEVVLLGSVALGIAGLRYDANCDSVIGVPSV
jgi:hypothetical protein